MTSRIFDDDVRAFREARLAALRKESYADLSASPRTSRLAAPSEFDGLEFRVERRPGELGGVRVEVRSCTRHFLLFLSSSSSGFEILPDGSIVEDEDPGIDD